MNNYYLSLLFFIFFFLSCNDQPPVQYHKTIENGKLVSEGYFKNDSIKVGKHTSYFPSGKIKSISNFDSFGKASGPTILFYPNGQIWQKQFYVSGSLNQDFIEFYPNGNLKTKSYYLNNKQLGDVFHYNENNKLFEYNFVDFNGYNRIYCKLDSLGKYESLKGINQFLIDSLVTIEGLLLPNDSLKLLFLIAQVPHTRAAIKLTELNAKHKILKEHSLYPNPCFQTFKLVGHDSLFKLRVTGQLFDSISSKAHTIISDYQIN